MKLYEQFERKSEEISALNDYKEEEGECRRELERQRKETRKENLIGWGFILAYIGAFGLGWGNDPFGNPITDFISPILMITIFISFFAFVPKKYQGTGGPILIGLGIIPIPSLLFAIMVIFQEIGRGY